MDNDVHGSIAIKMFSEYLSSSFRLFEIGLLFTFVTYVSQIHNNLQRLLYSIPNLNTPFNFEKMWNIQLLQQIFRKANVSILHGSEMHCIDLRHCTKTTKTISSGGIIKSPGFTISFASSALLEQFKSLSLLPNNWALCFFSTTYSSYRRRFS